MSQKSSFIIEESENALTRLRIRFRKHRAKIFRDNFHLTAETRVLDLGGWNGAHIHAVLENSAILPANVYVADIDEHAVNEAAARYGFTPVIINEADQLPFPDKFFDIVFCSSVIEHVTVPKEEVWTLISGQRFKDIAQIRQNEFAKEIRRLGKG
ncbi:MAG: class I SAM-dependent methyltransferase, partial [Betaproteobacteria bacterium]|nr:class I SAM-dependent methyltransferase [Betaproteobacteria bacterium]